MANSYFQFKQFTIHQDRCAMKVTTDSCLFGAWVAERIRNEKSIIDNCLDIGTGTGLLALMLAQGNKFSIDAVEIDKEAFEQSSKNIAASHWTDRIKILHGDAREYVFPYKYDVIISNPPFYEKELKSDDTKKNIARHNEGLLLPELIEVIKKNLKPDGSFYLLLPFKRNEEIRKILTEYQLAVQQITFVRQTVNHDYFRMMIAGKLKPTETVETIIDEISIHNNMEQYPRAFLTLLKDYYLHL